MSKENKQELIEALGGYLPHGVWIDLNGMAGKLNNLYVTHLYNGTDTVQEVDAAIDFCGDGDFINVEHFKPILRPMSDATPEENEKYNSFDHDTVGRIMAKKLAYLNSRFLDYRDMIGRNLAKKAEKGFYF